MHPRSGSRGDSTPSSWGEGSRNWTTAEPSTSTASSSGPAPPRNAQPRTLGRPDHDRAQDIRAGVAVAPRDARRDTDDLAGSYDPGLSLAEEERRLSLVDDPDVRREEGCPVSALPRRDLDHDDVHISAVLGA